MVSFGGAGGLHACSIANLLNISTILLPLHAGLLSAYGILNAPIERFTEKQILKLVSQVSFENLEIEFLNLAKKAIELVEVERISQDKIEIKKQLIFCRLKGQDSSIEIDFNHDFIHTFFLCAHWSCALHRLREGRERSFCCLRY